MEIDNKYTGIGQGTYNTVAGSIGLASAVLGNGFLSNIFGGGNGNEITDLKTKNALLEAELASDHKVTALREELYSNVSDLKSKIDANAAAQALVNCGMSNATSVLQTQMASVLAMTKVMIPSTNVYTASST